MFPARKVPLTRDFSMRDTLTLKLVGILVNNRNEKIAVSSLFALTLTYASPLEGPLLPFILFEDNHFWFRDNIFCLEITFFCLEITTFGLEITSLNLEIIAFCYYNFFYLFVPFAWALWIMVALVGS